MKTISKLWILIAVLALLTPVGLILPKYFNAGGAWGEWGAGEIKDLVGYIPEGFKRLSSVWNAPAAGYSFVGFKINPFIGYALSAVIGVLIIVMVILIAGRSWSKR